MRGALERLLRPVAEVRRDEAASALLMTLLIFLLLAAYYLMKTVREVLILTEGGAEVKSYSSAGQALLLLLIVPAYGAFASKVRPVRLVTLVTLFFASHLVLFIIAVQAGLRVGVVYFLWLGIFNLMVIAQFWAFATDLYSPEQGKRLFPLIGVGASLGAWVGSVRAGQLMAIGPRRLMVGAAVTLLVCVVLARVVNRVTERDAARKTAAADDKPLAAGNGFAMIFADRYLLLIALLAVLINVVNTMGEYLFGRYVVEAALAAHPDDPAAREQFIGAAYSRLFSTVNLVGFLLQMFVVSRVFKFLGVGKSLFIHPIVALVGYLMMMRAPSITTMGWFKVADNSLDYSLGNTTKQALWLPTSREAKYKAQATTETFFWRAGDVAQAGLVYFGVSLGLGLTAFTKINLSLTLVWLGVAAMLYHEHRRLTQEK
jgi:AAA family ATP:ADP antiporter